MENREKTVEESIGNVGYSKPPKAHQFKPGQSGNPKGRPKNPLKEYSLREFESWTDAQKKKFLKKVNPIDRWKMTEGNPKQDTDITSGGKPIPLFSNVLNHDSNEQNKETE